jgi:hypothetical protein
VRNKKGNKSISNFKIRNHTTEREREREREIGRKRVEDADIILNCILKKRCLRVVVGLRRLRTKTSKGILLRCYWGYNVDMHLNEALSGSASE